MASTRRRFACTSAKGDPSLPLGEGNPVLHRRGRRAAAEFILNLTRDLGVNLAGVEIILDMREKMNQMQREFENFLQYIRENIAQEMFTADERSKSALVPRRRIELVVKHGRVD